MKANPLLVEVRGFERTPEKKVPAAFGHLLYVVEALRKGRPFDASILGREIGVGRRTVVRDITLLRSLGWDICWDPVAREYNLKYAPPPRFL